MSTYWCVYDGYVCILQLFALHGHLFVLCHRTLHMFSYSCHPSSLSSILGHQRVDIQPQTETPPPGPLSWSKSVGSHNRTVFMKTKIICIIYTHYFYMNSWYRLFFCVSEVILIQHRSQQVVFRVTKYFYGKSPEKLKCIQPTSCTLTSDTPHPDLPYL